MNVNTAPTLRTSTGYSPTMSAESTPARPLRRDAVDNRRRLLHAATQAFAEKGLALDVRDIAKRAGVGIGTIYRHFATKEILIDAVVDEALDRWAKTVRESALASDPWEGFVRFMEQSLDLLAEHRALLDGLTDPRIATPRIQQCQAELRIVLAGLIERMQAAGAIRAGTTVDDVSLLMIGLGRIIQVTEDQAPGSWRRQLDIMLAGLRAGDR
ncbi:DNA-binding transcriptional regulator, AcrR family [Actinoplanes derwentensis]|uniref:DNA-binding transcriptional regulator, AcrR family n=2 Tax=Actinoplanes derwentensis TaxID=113562 RepID=A0A1H1UCA0_9ACTN|nr:DNA-binding transcriptional regulator, AcrR family [Actinoplanes derwentensis]